MLLNVIRKNFCFFIFSFLLGSICIWATADKSHLPYFLKLYAELFLELYLLCIPLSFIKPKPRAACQWILSIILYIVAIVDLFCFVRIGSTLSPAILRLMLETTPSEATDFFGTYITADVFFSPVGLILLLFVCQITFAIIKPFNDIRFHKFLQIPLCLLLATGIYSSIENIQHIIKTWQFDTINEIENYFGEEYYASRAQYLPIHRLLFAIHADNIAKRQVKTLRTTLKDVQIDSCTFTSPNIVLIIGESYNKHHSELYGYWLPTTPNQMSFAENNQLFVFSDAVTPSNITSYAFKNAFH